MRYPPYLIPQFQPFGRWRYPFIFVPIMQWEKYSYWNGRTVRVRPERAPCTPRAIVARFLEYVTRRHQRHGRTGTAALNFRRMK